MSYLKFYRGIVTRLGQLLSRVELFTREDEPGCFRTVGHSRKSGQFRRQKVDFRDRKPYFVKNLVKSHPCAKQKHEFVRTPLERTKNIRSLNVKTHHAGWKWSCKRKNKSENTKKDNFNLS